MFTLNYWISTKKEKADKREGKFQLEKIEQTLISPFKFTYPELEKNLSRHDLASNYI